MSQAKQEKTYVLKLDLSNPIYKEFHEKVQKELAIVNAPVQAIAKELGKRVKTKLNKESDVVIEMLGNMPESKRDDLMYRPLGEEEINELCYKGFCLTHPEEKVSQSAFWRQKVGNMKSPQKELKKFEEVALKYYQSLFFDSSYFLNPSLIFLHHIHLL